MISTYINSAGQVKQRTFLTRGWKRERHHDRCRCRRLQHRRSVRTDTFLILHRSQRDANLKMIRYFNILLIKNLANPRLA